MQNSHSPFLLKSKRILIDNELTSCSLLIKEGIIKEIIISEERFNKLVKSIELYDLDNLVVMPGIIDSHVHINEPGRTEWEGFDTATKSAAAGGITTLIDMPLNSTPVTTTVENFNFKLEAAENQMHVNCGFWGGVVPDNINDLPNLLASGVLGIKAFLTHSGIDDFPNVTESDFDKSMNLFAQEDIPLLVHCELSSNHEGIKQLENDPTNYLAYLASRPKEWEDKAIALMIKLCEKYNCHVHIVHLSSSNSIEPIKIAKDKGLPITIETCPHYIALHAEEIPNGNTLFKCAPPIREKENNEQLWKAIKDGIIDFIVTDHSPATPELKEMESGSFLNAWGGIASVQFSLPVFWTEAKKRDFKVNDISKLMSGNIATIFNLEGKGKIKEGFDADLTVWNPEEEFFLSKEIIQHRHKLTPYVNKNYLGKVYRTYVGGNLVYQNGRFLSLSKGNTIIKQQKV